MLRDRRHQVARRREPDGLQTTRDPPPEPVFAIYLTGLATALLLAIPFILILIVFSLPTLSAQDSGS